MSGWWRVAREGKNRMRSRDACGGLSVNPSRAGSATGRCYIALLCLSCHSVLMDRVPFWDSCEKLVPGDQTAAERAALRKANGAEDRRESSAILHWPRGASKSESEAELICAGTQSVACRDSEEAVYMAARVFVLADDGSRRIDTLCNRANRIKWRGAGDIERDRRRSIGEL